MGRRRKTIQDLPVVGILTPRQLRVVRLTFDGATNYEIAHALGLTSEVVRNELHAAYRSTGARNRPHLAALVWWELEGKNKNGTH